MTEDCKTCKKGLDWCEECHVYKSMETNQEIIDLWKIKHKSCSDRGLFGICKIRPLTLCKYQNCPKVL